MDLVDERHLSESDNQRERKVRKRRNREREREREIENQTCGEKVLSRSSASQPCFELTEGKL